jgi:DNA-binding transcriptional MerR regulator
MVQSSEELHNIDALAHLSGVPSRTIRFYNTQGMLPPPIMHGRIAYYNQEHLLVLSIIKELKEQQKLPLENIKQLLEVRARHGDVQMNLALKQRLLRPLTSNAQEVRISKRALMQQTGVSEARIDELASQGLLFPVKSGENVQSLFTGDDILLLQIYERLEFLGLPTALSSLIRFHLRQLVRSERAAFEQHLQARWQEEGLPVEQQAEQFEAILTLTDTLISVLHRKMVFQ